MIHPPLSEKNVDTYYKINSGAIGFKRILYHRKFLYKFTVFTLVKHGVWIIVVCHIPFFQSEMHHCIIFQKINECTHIFSAFPMPYRIKKVIYSVKQLLMLLINLIHA